jgi:hypothetical protein
MTRLDAMRALLALPCDGYLRSHNVVQAADGDKLRITRVKLRTKSTRKPRRKKAKSSRLAFVRAVHIGKGA